ncbi:MAG: hypothetical protein IKX21_02040 [Deltaproteobacteria bacterium]|nr:hypothetical protein [Deltaproteobacteria bacterium]
MFNRTLVANAILKVAKSLTAAKTMFDQDDRAWLTSHKFSITPDNQWAKRAISGTTASVVVFVESGKVGAMFSGTPHSKPSDVSFNIHDAPYGSTAEQAVRSLGVAFATAKNDAFKQIDAKLAKFNAIIQQATNDRNNLSKEVSAWKQTLNAFESALK